MKKLRKILFVCLLLVFALSFTACAVKERYNGVGSAQINLTLEDDYGDVSVTCPGANITNDGLKFTISLSLIVHTDIIVSSYGYEPEIIHFTTKELSQGNIDKTVSLMAKQKTLNLSIDKHSYSQLEDVQIFANNEEELNFVIEKNSLKIPINIENQVLTVRKQGYFPYELDLSEVVFKNFSASVKIPFIAENSDNILISIKADSEVPKHSLPYSITKYENERYVVSSGYIEKNNLLTLNKDMNLRLNIGWQDNTYFSARQLTKLYDNGDVYQTYNLSQLYTKELPSEQIWYSYTLDIIGDLDRYLVEFYDQNGDSLQGLYSETTTTASKVTVLIYNEREFSSLYVCDVEKTGKITLEAGKIEPFETTINFVDIDNIPLSDISARLSYYTRDFNYVTLDLLQEVDEVSYDSEQCAISFDLSELFQEYEVNLLLNFSFVDNVDVTLSYWQLIKASQTIVVDNGYDIAIEFFDENGHIDAEDVIKNLEDYTFKFEDGLLKSKPEHKIFDNGHIPLEMHDKYKSLSLGYNNHLFFVRSMFDYDEGLSAYKFDFHLTEGVLIELRVNIEDEGILTPIDSVTLDFPVEIYILDDYQSYIQINKENVNEIDLKFYANKKHTDFAIHASIYGGFMGSSATVTVKQKNLDDGFIELNIKAPKVYEITKY